MDKRHVDYLTPDLLKSEEQIWVNPVGGLGDIIMLSTAMKRSYDVYKKKFCIARRAQYTEFLSSHPAVQEIGHPPIGSAIVCNDYWMRPEFQDVNKKALAITCKIFGINEIEDEELFLPVNSENVATDILKKTVPWGSKNIAIVFSSESPRYCLSSSMLIATVFRKA